MFRTDVGTTDRIIRVVVGLALIAGFLLNPGGVWSWLYLIGIVPLVTGVVGSCLVYSLLGISTCPTKG
jgi:hypothetical protein